MDGRESRSKRPSATSSPWPPEDLVFFIERSLGRRLVADALREQGVRVEVHDDHFPAAARDVEWLEAVGSRGWIVLTKDARIRYIALERDALLAAGIKAFVLTSGNMTGESMARILVRHLRRMVHLIRTHPAPFIAGVTRSRVQLYVSPARSPRGQRPPPA